MDYVQEQRAWWKKEFHHNRPIIDRAWKILRKSIVKQQKEFMRDYRAQFGEDLAESIDSSFVDTPASAGEMDDDWAVVPYDPSESSQWFFRRRLPGVEDLGKHIVRHPDSQKRSKFDYMRLQEIVKDLFNHQPPSTPVLGATRNP